MDPIERYRAVNVALFLAALVHALWTWPFGDVVALFVGGAAIAFVGEVTIVSTGLLEHRMEPQLAGVPIPVLLVWPAVVYLFLRIALLVVPAGFEAAALAAVLATLADVAADPPGVRDGVWRYPEHPLSEPRFLGVPWWNFLGWLAIVFVTATLPMFL